MTTKHRLQVSLLFFAFCSLSVALYAKASASEEMSEHDLRILKELTLYHFEEGEHAQSLEAAQKYLTQAPEDAEVLNLRGLTQFKYKKYFEAEQDLLAAIDHAPDSTIRSYYRVNLAEVYRESNKVQESLDQLKLALSDSPKDPEIQRLVGGVTGPGLYVKLKQNAQKTSHTSATVQLSTRYDSNVLLKPDDDLAASSVSSKSSLIIPVFGEGRYTLSALTQQDMSIRAHLAYNLHLNRDLQNFDSLDMGLGISEIFSEGRQTKISLTDDIHNYSVNSSGMTSLLLENRLTPLFDFEIRQNKHLIFKLPLSYGHFANDAQEVKNKKTYFKTELASELHTPVWTDFLGVFGGALLLNESEGVNYRQFGGRLLTRITHQAGDNAYNPFCTAEIRYLRFLDRQLERTDKTLVLSVGVSKNFQKELGQNIFTQANFLFERNFSDDALAAYSKSSSTVSIGYRL